MENQKVIYEKTSDIDRLLIITGTHSLIALPNMRGTAKYGWGPGWTPWNSVGGLGIFRCQPLGSNQGTLDYD